MKTDPITARTWTVNLLGSPDDYLSGEDNKISVTISEDACPMVIDHNGKNVPDHGNATWPKDKEVADEASRLIGAPVRVRFWDVGDNLLEALYDVELI